MEYSLNDDFKLDNSDADWVFQIIKKGKPTVQQKDTNYLYVLILWQNPKKIYNLVKFLAEQLCLHDNISDFERLLNNFMKSDSRCEVVKSLEETLQDSINWSVENLQNDLCEIIKLTLQNGSKKNRQVFDDRVKVMSEIMNIYQRYERGLKTIMRNKALMIIDAQKLRTTIAENKATIVKLEKELAEQEKKLKVLDTYANKMDSDIDSKTDALKNFKECQLDVTKSIEYAKSSGLYIPQEGLADKVPKSTTTTVLEPLDNYSIWEDKLKDIKETVTTMQNLHHWRKSLICPHDGSDGNDGGDGDDGGVGDGGVGDGGVGDGDASKSSGDKSTCSTISNIQNTQSHGRPRDPRKRVRTNAGNASSASTASTASNADGPGGNKKRQKISTKSNVTS